MRPTTSKISAPLRSPTVDAVIHGDFEHVEEVEVREGP